MEACREFGEGFRMIKRARISLLVAVVAAFFGFTGVLTNSAELAQVICYLFLAVSALSFLFCLFEDCQSEPEYHSTFNKTP